MPFVPTESTNDAPAYQSPPLTPESRAIAVVHRWLESPTPWEASQFDVAELIRLIECQIVIALSEKDERILALVRQWERAYLNHDRQGEHNAVRLIARECGGDLEDFTGIPAYE